MNWAYLAGFFDGEGCVNMASRNDSFFARLTFSQSKDCGFTLLNEIREFLLAQGIKVGKVHKGGYSPYTKRPSWQLQITARSGVFQMLNAMLPYLRIKRPAAQDALRTMLLFPTARA